MTMGTALAMRNPMKGGSSHHAKLFVGREFALRWIKLGEINNLGPRPRGESDRRGNKFAHVRLQSLACLPVRWLRQIFISEAFPNRRYPQLAA